MEGMIWTQSAKMSIFIWGKHRPSQGYTIPQSCPLPHIKANSTMKSDAGTQREVVMEAKIACILYERLLDALFKANR